MASETKWPQGTWGVAQYSKRKYGLGVRGYYGGGAFLFLAPRPEDTTGFAAEDLQAALLLIQSAPTLYEALKECMEALADAHHELNHSNWGDGDRDWYTIAEAEARAALALARGEGR